MPLSFYKKIYKRERSTLKKKVLWNGTAWVNMDGTSLGEQPTQDDSR